MADEELSGATVLGGLLDDDAGLEAGFLQEPEPDGPAEQAPAMLLVDHAHRVVGVMEHKGELCDRPGVVGVGIPRPLEVAHSPTVGVVTAAVIGVRLEALGRAVGHQDGDTARSAVDEDGGDHLRELDLAGHVHHCVVDEDGVEAAPEPHRSHVALVVVALRVELPGHRQHLR